jgi:hypothetical protein
MANEDSKMAKRKLTVNSKKRAKEVLDLFQKANSGVRSKWKYMEQKSFDFFLNSQLTEEELLALREAGMPDFTINRVTPVIETMKYFVTANNPRWKAIGSGGEDIDMASVHTDIIDYCWALSGGKSLLSQAVQDALVKSKGYMHIYVDPDADRGMGEVKFEKVDPFHVYVSSRSSDFLERDATYHIIKKDLPRHELLNRLPQYAGLIKRASGEQTYDYLTERDVDDENSIQLDDMEQPTKPDGSEDDMLPYYEVYEPIRVPYYNLFVRIAPPESEVASAKEQIDLELEKLASELEVAFLEKERELRAQLERGEIIKERYDLELTKSRAMIGQSLEEQRSIMYNRIMEEASKVEQRVVTEEEYNELKKLISSDIVSATPYNERKVKKTCVVGDRMLYEQILNITSSPLIPIPYLHTGSPCPMSAVQPLIGKQREINKAHQIMIHNANLSSNLRWLYVEGELDEDEWESYSSSPSALLKYHPGFSASGPREIQPQNINNAFFTIEQDSKSDLEYIAGIQPPSMGMSSGSDETYRGFLAKDEYGTRRIRSWVSNVLEPALEHIGRIFQEMAQDTYSIHKVFRIVQPNNAGEYDGKETEINVPIYDDLGEEIGRWNDYASSRYDVRLVAGSTLPVNRWAIAEEYKQYFELGAIDDIAFIQEIDIKNKEALIERKALVNRLQGEIKSYEDEIKQLNGDIETLRRQIIQSGIRDEVRQAGVEVDRSKTETKMADKLMQERLRDELKSFRSEMKKEFDVMKSQMKNDLQKKNEKK